jgi:hypothetical protein
LAKKNLSKLLTKGTVIMVIRAAFGIFSLANDFLHHNSFPQLIHVIIWHSAKKYWLSNPETVDMVKYTQTHNREHCAAMYQAIFTSYSKTSIALIILSHFQLFQAQNVNIIIVYLKVHQM